MTHTTSMAKSQAETVLGILYNIIMSVHHHIEMKQDELGKPTTKKKCCLWLCYHYPLQNIIIEVVHGDQHVL